MLGRVSEVSNSPGKFLVNVALIAATDSGVSRGGACSCQDGECSMLLDCIPLGIAPAIWDWVTKTRPCATKRLKRPATRAVCWVHPNITPNSIWQRLNESIAIHAVNERKGEIRDGLKTLILQPILDSFRDLQFI